MGALDEVPLLKGGPAAKPGTASYTQVMLRCCEEVVRRLEDPMAFLFGSFGGAKTRAGNALYAKWQARRCAVQADALLPVPCLCWAAGWRMFASLPGLVTCRSWLRQGCWSTSSAPSARPAALPITCSA